MRQGGATPTAAWTGSAVGGGKAPEPILLPDPAQRFGRTAARLERLTEGHPMEGWLGFTADVSDAQRVVAEALPAFAGPDATRVLRVVEARIRRWLPTAGGATRSVAKLGPAARPLRPSPRCRRL